MSNEYLSPNQNFIRDNTAANKALITEKKLFTRAQLEEIGGKLRIAGFAKLSSEAGSHARKFNYHSPGKVQLVDDAGAVFEAFLIVDGSWKVEVNGKHYNQQQLAEAKAA